MNYFRIKHTNIVYYYVKYKIIEKKIINILYIFIKNIIIDELIKFLKASKFLIFKKLIKLFKRLNN